MGQLSEKQQELAAASHDLIYSFMYNHHLKMDDTKDWYGFAAEALCFAASRFEPFGYIMFEPFAYITMEYMYALEIYKSESIRIVLEHQFYLSHLSNAYASSRTQLRRFDNRVFSALAASGFDMDACSLLYGISREEVEEIYAEVLYIIDMRLNSGQSFIE